MKTTREMKAAIEKMNTLFDECDRLMFTDEAASDKAYFEACAISAELTNTIVKVSKGLIDKATAGLMVRKYPDRLIAICEKFA